jgi:hypothetical protein
MQSYSIDEWCDKHRISRGTWYNLFKAGKSPACIKIGSRVIITAEADLRWCREREAAASRREAPCDDRSTARDRTAGKHRPPNE